MPATVADKLNDPVTQHMRRAPAVLRLSNTAADSLTSIREQKPADRILYFYVVDADGKLCGVVPTRRLLLAEPNTPLRDLMATQVVTLPAAATVLEACEFFVLHKLLAFPVVDADRKLLGVVDVELYTSELEDLDRGQRSDQLFELIGVHFAESQQSSPWLSFRGRFPWLLANICGGLLAAFLTGIFEAELQKVVALALFIPVVLALAESVSIQSVSLTLQSMQRQRPTLKLLAARLRTEAATGLLLGIACAAIISMVAWLWQGGWQVPVCLLGGIGGGVFCAAVIGMLTPRLLRLIQRQPHVAAGPIALALADMATLTIYFSLARWLLR